MRKSKRCTDLSLSLTTAHSNECILLENHFKDTCTAVLINTTGTNSQEIIQYTPIFSFSILI